MSLKSDLLNMTFIVPVSCHLAQSRAANGILIVLQLFFIVALRLHNICHFTAVLLKKCRSRIIDVVGRERGELH